MPSFNYVVKYVTELFFSSKQPTCPSCLQLRDAIIPLLSIQKDFGASLPGRIPHETYAAGTEAHAVLREPKESKSFRRRAPRENISLSTQLTHRNLVQQSNKSQIQKGETEVHELAPVKFCAEKKHGNGTGLGYEQEAVVTIANINYSQLRGRVRHLHNCWLIEGSPSSKNRTLRLGD